MVKGLVGFTDLEARLSEWFGDGGFCSTSPGYPHPAASWEQVEALLFGRVRTRWGAGAGPQSPMGDSASTWRGGFGVHGPRSPRQWEGATPGDTVPRRKAAGLGAQDSGHRTVPSEPHQEHLSAQSPPVVPSFNTCPVLGTVPGAAETVAKTTWGETGTK